MPKFNYTAMDASGRETNGTVEAPSQSQAIAKIRGQQLFPTRITAADGRQVSGPSAGKDRTSGGGKQQGLSREITLPAFLQPKIKAKDLMILTRQLATLIDAGLPLLRGLRVLLKQARSSTMRKTLSGMGESVEQGSTFSEALALFPRVFSPLYVNMVRAGEAGGVLEVVLTRLAEFMEKAQRIKNKVRSAMIYPVVVLVAAIGILIFLLLNVIPRFEEIFVDLLGDQRLPAVTVFVIGASNLVKNNIFTVIVSVVAVIVLVKLWGKTGRGRRVLDATKLRMPLFGTLLRRTAVARVSRTLGTLMSSGVPVLQALSIVRDTSGNAVVADALQQVHDSVKEGESMTTPLGNSRVFPDMVVSMVEVGEETGALPEMLIRIADTYDDEVDNAVEGLTSVIEPIMIIFLAVIVGTIVIAMFLPLITIITTLGQA